MKHLCLILFAMLWWSPVGAAKTYWVDNMNPRAADSNSGTEAAPWKTLAFAGKAAVLKAGDTVLIKSGVYRECLGITVSGQPDKPITFAAAPAARVVIKGSEIVHGPWTRLGDPANPKSSVADRHTWKVKLDERFFRDPGVGGAYDDKSKRWVSQVFWQDDNALKMIGPDAIYKNDGAYNIEQIGRTRADLFLQSFFFDPSDQTLYVNFGGEPSWYVMEVGVRAFALTAIKTHDLIIRGLEMRHNRQPGGQWPIVAFNGCQRVTMEDCKVLWADFTGVGFVGNTNCTLRHCELMHNGGVGLLGSMNEDCLIENCKLMFNNYRHLGSDWGVAAGIKLVPGNKRITVRGSEAAYNDAAEGIWFDTDNEDIRILDNVCHHNGGSGIFFEINRRGGIIAGNLVYANNRTGIYISGSQKTYVVHNTVVENDPGIAVVIRGKDQLPKDNFILNNILINNYVTGLTINRGADLILHSPADAAGRMALGSVSDYNVYASNSWTPAMRPNWNDDHPFAQWQKRFGHDEHSRLMLLQYERFGTDFRLITRDGLDVAGPLPEAVTRVWTPANPKQVGSPLMQWPSPKPF